MPNGYESPLNKLADALPSFILQMQDMKMRQETQEALNEYRQTMLARQIETERAERETKDAIEQVKRDIGIYEPPEFKLLLDNISYELRALNDPDIGITLDDDDIIKRWKKVTNMEADYYGKTGRHVSISMPIPVEQALGRIEVAKPPPLAAPPPREPKPRVFETKEEYQKRIAEPPKPPEPKRPPIPAYRAGYAPPPPPEGVTVVEPVITIPEGARSILTVEGGWIYTLDEKTWISAETGEPITGQ